MPTRSERQALVFLGVVALLGGGVRLMRAHGAPPHSSAQVPFVARADSVTPGAHIARKRRAARDTNLQLGSPKRLAPARKDSTPKRPPLASRPKADRSHPVDVDRATVADLQALPGIGPALAARIVAYRDSNGPFGGLDRFGRVRGIGPATLKRLDSLVTFSGTPRL